MWPVNSSVRGRGGSSARRRGRGASTAAEEARRRQVRSEGAHKCRALRWNRWAGLSELCEPFIAESSRAAARPHDVEARSSRARDEDEDFDNVVQEEGVTACRLAWRLQQMRAHGALSRSGGDGSWRSFDVLREHVLPTVICVREVEAVNGDNEAKRRCLEEAQDVADLVEALRCSVVAKYVE